jgi:hypothetical protein
MNYDLEFENFSPSIYLEQIAHAMVQRMAELAPYSASCQAVIRKEGPNFVVEVEILSQSKLFMAMRAEADAQIALDATEYTIEEQIKKWRESRFDSAHSELSRPAA